MINIYCSCWKDANNKTLLLYVCVCIPFLYGKHVRSLLKTLQWLHIWCHTRFIAIIWWQRQNLTIIQISYQRFLKFLANCGNPSPVFSIGTNLKYWLIPPYWIHYTMFSKYFPYMTAHIRMLAWHNCHYYQRGVVTRGNYTITLITCQLRWQL